MRIIHVATLLWLGLSVACTSVAKKPVSLDDPKSGWQYYDMGASGEASVEQGVLHLGMGERLTVFKNTRAMNVLPNHDAYALSFDAQLVAGHDIFCGLTFPIGEQHASLVLNGWSMGVCGISCIDGLNASENETTVQRFFDTGRWYHIELRVTPKKLEVDLDGERLVDVAREGRTFSLYGNVEDSKPLAFFTFATEARIRDVMVSDLSR